MMTSLRVSVLAALAVAAIQPAQAGGGRVIALASGSGGRVIALTDMGAVFSLRPDARSWTDSPPVAEVPYGLQPIDLTVFSSGKSEYAAVSAAARRGSKAPATLYLIELNAKRAKPQAITLGPGPFTGLVYDAARQRILIADARQAALFEAAPIPAWSPKVRYLRDFANLKTIGPVALDRAAGRLYCADPVAGLIYSVEFGSWKYSLVAERLGEIRALALDASQGKLYIGDAARRRVWMLRLANRGAKPEPVAAGIKLRDPAGLAVDDAGNLWIADSEGGAIHILKPDGQLLRTLR